MHAAQLVLEVADLVAEAGRDFELQLGGGRQQSRGKSPVPGLSSRARAAVQAAGHPEAGAPSSAARGELVGLITELTEQMHATAAELQFEVAARLRDEIRDLKHELRGMHAAGV